MLLLRAIFVVCSSRSGDLLEELHKGICESHTGGRSLAHKDPTQGYWRPSMQKTS